MGDSRRYGRPRHAAPGMIDGVDPWTGTRSVMHGGDRPADDGATHTGRCWRVREPGRLLARGTAALLADLGWAVLHEMPLGNRRRVDLLAIDRRGRIAIVEVKSSLADWRADGKWPEYLPWCDLFYFAVPEDFPRAVLEEASARPEIAGLMVVDGFSGAILRPAAECRLSPARRRALTLRFARAAAQRLARDGSTPCRSPCAD